MTLLSFEDWTTRAGLHLEQTSPFADAFTARRQLGQKHPVHDFLFTYYNCSPQKLKQWVPAYNQTLEFNGDAAKEYPWLNDYWFCRENNLLYLNKSRAPKHMRGLAGFVARLCTTILERPPRFGCFGLHEWAMVYKSSSDALRHQGYPLRLHPRELIQFVESQHICCSHYDAYRFFTPEALPLNTLNPTLESRLEMEQGGCVHVNMDLYKWAVKLWPWVGSDFINKAFFLAQEARDLDMRANPYDLSAQGYTPIPIETEDGRKNYQKQQKIIFEKSIPLRIALLHICEGLQNF